MKIRLCLIVGCLLLLLGQARADVPGRRGPPGPPIVLPPQGAVSFRLEVSNEPNPRLIVPKPLLPRARELGLVAPESPGRWVTVGIGLALTLFVSLGGLAVVRWRSWRRPGVLLLLAGALAAGHQTLLANPVPVPGFGESSAWASPADKVLEGVQVQVVDSGDTIRLLLPRKQLSSLR